MTKKEKFKKFVAEHETDIAYFEGCVATLIGCAISYHMMFGRGKHIVEVKNESLWTVLNSAMNIKSNVNMYTGIADKPIEVGKLGEMGKAILESGGTKDMTFTHFIAIGESK
jgi:hypothetical protein